MHADGVWPDRGSSIRESKKFGRSHDLGCHAKGRWKRDARRLLHFRLALYTKCVYDGTYGV